jgi:hypothetical protein
LKGRIMTLRLFSSRRRPMHLGPYPLERLPRTAAAPDFPVPPPAAAPAPTPDSDVSEPDRRRGMEAYRGAIKPAVYRRHNGLGN